MAGHRRAGSLSFYPPGARSQHAPFGNIISSFQIFANYQVASCAYLESGAALMIPTSIYCPPTV